MELSIIIVNWNSREYLRDCIASILDAKVQHQFEVIVIDSGSFDGSREMLAHAYPQVIFIQSTTNIGFAKANNEAFKVATGRTVLFLNPDTIVVGSAIDTLYEWLDRLPNAGAVGCKLLNTDGSLQTSCIQSFPTIMNQLLISQLSMSVFPKSRLWGIAPLISDSKAPTPVEVLSGACIMMPRSLFQEVGFFSEEYFMYTEDVDLCHKINNAGHVNYHVPTAVMFHFGGGSSQKRPSEFSVVTMRTSTWQFLRKTRGPNYSALYRSAMLAAAFLRLVLLIILFPFYLALGRLEGWGGSLRKWLAILKWSTRIRAGSDPSLSVYPQNTSTCL
jgi:N-acetylglucosaminyl-diphospho-decaprenol L-rhamnosyltransferase